MNEKHTNEDIFRIVEGDKVFTNAKLMNEEVQHLVDDFMDGLRDDCNLNNGEIASIFNWLVFELNVQTLQDRNAAKQKKK